MVATANLQNFFLTLEKPNDVFFKSGIDTKSLYHDESRNSVIACGQAMVIAPEIKHGIDIFGENVTSLNFIHTSLITVTIDKEEINFGQVQAESESDCYDENCDFPIHAKLTLNDGTIRELSIYDLIDSTNEDYYEVTDILKKYMPYSVIRELIEQVDLKSHLTDKVISKLLWPTASNSKD